MITSTPYLTWARMVWRICSGPSAMEKSRSSGEHGDAGFRGVVVEVAVTSGNGEWRAGGDDARTRDEAFVDGVAEIDRHERPGAYVADGGEACIEGSLGVDDAGVCGSEGGALEGVDGVVLVGTGAEVDVAVDEAGEDVIGGEVDDFCAERDGEGGGFNGLDAVAGEDQDYVVAVDAGFAVEEMARFDVGGGWSWGLCGEGEGKQ